MNSITEAMKKVGISIPQIKRVWVWLKDHPEKTSKEIGLAIGLDPSIVSALLHNLKSRGMVTSRKEYNISSSFSKSPGRNYITVYRTVGAEYELLPVKKTPRPAAIKAEVLKVSAATPTPNPVVKKKFSIDDLSVYEAKELYEQLKTIFA